MKVWNVACSGGCGATVPAIIPSLVWACVDCVDTVSVGWPAPDQPCDRDAECEWSCESDGYGGFAREGERGGNGEPVEDVLFECRCEHHGDAAAMRSHSEPRS